MGERKVQAKYYPPDFDPSNLPRIRKKRENDDAVRFMLPMSVRCETCGEFMGTGLKFNARKSNTGDDYLGIRIFRFTMKCKGCPATFAIRTDPKNSDYSCESGVRRNYEPWKHKKQADDEGKAERDRQDADAIQALENKTMDAKQQMEELDQLDEIKAANAKRAKVDVDAILASYDDSQFTLHNVSLSKDDEAEIERQAAATPTIVQPLSTDYSNVSHEGVYNKGPASTKGQPAFSGLMTLKVKKKIAKKKEGEIINQRQMQTPLSDLRTAYGDLSSSDSDG